MNRAVFLDRDGVINAALYNPLEGKPDSPYRLEDFRLLPGVSQAVRAINEMGFLAVVVSNQPGVAKGRCGAELLEAVNREVIASLAREGARLDGIYYCLHHPQAVVPALRLDCHCRKPRPGLLLRAAKELDIDLARSYMIGDQLTDVEAGLAAGCKTVLLNGHRPGTVRTEAPPVHPHWTAENLLSSGEGDPRRRREKAMEIFIDSANLEEIRRWMEYGVVDGVTTNPTILLKDGGYDIEERAKEIAALVYPRPVSVEVTTNHQEQMIDEARGLASWAPNIVVKIPVINEYGEPCLGVVKALVEEGIRVNMTACLSFGQVVLGAKAGATYISIFAGRVADEGHDAPRLIRQAVDWLKQWGCPSKIIAGSVREVINVQDAALAGAHVVTVPPQFMSKLIDHYYSRATVQQFNADAAKALSRMAELQAQVRR